MSENTYRATTPIIEPDTDIRSDAEGDGESVAWSVLRGVVRSVIVERTGCPTTPGGPLEPEEFGARVPYAMLGEMSRLDYGAGILYRIIAEYSKDGPRTLYLIEATQAPEFHTVEDVLASADALERQGWLRRQRPEDGRERWTPLGRDQPRADPHITPRQQVQPRQWPHETVTPAPTAGSTRTNGPPQPLTRENNYGLPRIAKGVAIRGADRVKLRKKFRKAYESGATIRDIVEATERSWSVVQTMLHEAGTQMRPRGAQPPTGVENADTVKGNR